MAPFLLPLLLLIEFDTFGHSLTIRCLPYRLRRQLLLLLDRLVEQRLCDAVEGILDALTIDS